MDTRGKILVQIRKEEKTLTISNVAEAFGMSRTTLNRRIKKGEVDPPGGEDGKYTIKDIKRLYEKFGHPEMKLLGRGKAYYNELVQCNFIFVNGGIFTVKKSVKGKRRLAFIKTMKEEIEKSSLMDAQGMNNHVHLRDCGVDNPVLQMVLAERLTERWLQKLLELRPKEKVLIDWLGQVDTAISIYLISPEDEKLVRTLERKHKIKRGVAVHMKLDENPGSILHD